MSPRLVAVVAVAVAVVVATVWLRDGEESRLERTRGLLRDEDRFSTAFEAGDTLARVGELLQDEGEACRRSNGERVRCARLLAGSAAAQVIAVRVLECTAPGRFEARRRLSAYVEALAEGEDPGGPPSHPDCG